MFFTDVLVHKCGVIGQFIVKLEDVLDKLAEPYFMERLG